MHCSSFCSALTGVTLSAILAHTICRTAPHVRILADEQAPRRARPRPMRLLFLLLAVAVAVVGGPIQHAAAQLMDVNARIRSQWQELRTICPNREFVSCQHANRSAWTAADKTQVTSFTYNGIGAWSSFTMQTYDGTGQPRTTGGDAWAIVLKDQQQGLRMATRVFDEGNGTYTVAAVFLQPGNYSAVARLYYSSCMGMQEPTAMPEGKSRESLTKDDHCHIGAKATLPRMLVAPSSEARSCRDGQLSSQRQVQWDSSARSSSKAPLNSHFPTQEGLVWNSDEYTYRQGNMLVTDRCFRPPVPERQYRFSRMFMYGDSTMRDAWWVLLGRAREQPCMVNLAPNITTDLAILNRGKLGNYFNASYCPPLSDWKHADPELDSILKRCTGGMPWTTVPVGTTFKTMQETYPSSLLMHFNHKLKYTREFEYNLGSKPRPKKAQKFMLVYLDHHACRDPDHMMRDLRPKYLHEGDVIVLNMGGWCYPVLGFTEWADRIDKLADGLRHIISTRGVMFVWRSSLVLQEHVFRTKRNAMNGYLGGGYHFMTDARRMEFESYAQDRMHQAGVLIWDVHAFSSLGINKEQDMIHASHSTHWHMDRDLMDTFICPAKEQGSRDSRAAL